MGVYDTVRFGHKNYQTKALGAAALIYVPGDVVRPMCISRTEEERDLARAHRYPDDVSTDFTFDALDEDGGEAEGPVIVRVREHRIVDVVDEPDTTHFDDRGRSAGVHRVEPIIEAEADQPAWSHRPATPPVVARDTTEWLRSRRNRRSSKP